jgi:hypothetical protein
LVLKPSFAKVIFLCVSKRSSFVADGIEIVCTNNNQADIAPITSNLEKSLGYIPILAHILVS